MKPEFAKIRLYYFFGTLIAVTLVFAWIVRPLLYPIIWAAVFAWLFYPLYRKINQSLIINRSIASFVTICIILIIFLIPALVISYMVFQQTLALYHSTEKEVATILDKIKYALEHRGDYSIIQFIESYGIDLQAEITKTLRTVSGYITSEIGSITKGTIIIGGQLLIMLYALYYFLKDGESILKKILELSPLDNKSDRLIYKRFTSVIKAALKGSLLVSIIQGVIAGIIFWIAGVSSPLFWGLVMVMLAVLPAVGPGLLAFPAGVILIITGQVWQGIFVLVFGVVFISIIDDLLRSYLVGKDSQIHPLLIFISIIGGLLIFGPTGFVIGPVVTSIMLTLWSMYEKQYRKELNQE